MSDITDAPRVIELVRVNAPGFDRGERAIMVDGIRWGRTKVAWRGRHGTATTFVQEGGHTLIENPGAKFEREITIRSTGKFERRRSSESNPFKTTEQQTLAKVIELVANGTLRDPAVVRAENERRMDEWRAGRAIAQQEEDAEFRRRAISALGLESDDAGDIIDRVVAAMRWAQTQ